MYPVLATKLSLTWHYGDMYPLVSGYKVLVWDTCILLHVSGVNAALGLFCIIFSSYNFDTELLLNLKSTLCVAALKSKVFLILQLILA